MVADERLTLLRDWAAQIAATLPPFTAEEIAVAGRLAGELDGRSKSLKKEQVAA